MTKTIEAPKVEKMERPARLWRNRFLPLANGVRAGTSVRVKKLTAYDSEFLWPSKETAEQKAYDAMEALRRKGSLGPLKYLGAFPVES